MDAELEKKPSGDSRWARCDADSLARNPSADNPLPSSGQRQDVDRSRGWALLRWITALAFCLFAIQQLLRGPPRVVAPILPPDGAEEHVGNDSVLIPFPRCNEKSEFVGEYAFEFAFPPAYFYNFYVNETISTGNVIGKIHITRAGEEQAVPVVVHAQVRANTADDFARIKFKQEEKGLRVASSDRTAGCVSVDIIVAIKPLLEFRDLRFDSGAFSIEVDSQVAFTAAQMTLVSKAGTIGSKQPRSGPLRTVAFAALVRVNTTSGSVIGTWGLSDTFLINSEAGDVDVDLVPLKYSYGPYTPAGLRVNTLSGDVALRMPSELSELSIRNYHTEVQSKAGSIKVNCVHGSRTSLRTDSGSIDAELLVWNDWEPHGSTLHTYCAQGSTNVRVLPHVNSPFYHENPLNWTMSDHTQLQGSLVLRYPKDWLGQVHGEVSKGRMSVHGPELEDVEWGSHSMSARKGNGGSDLNFYAGNGFVEIGIGED